MKTFRLSSPTERVSSILLTLLILAVEVVLVYTLRTETTILILTVIGCLLLGAAMIYSCLGTLTAACTPDAANKKLHVTGVRRYTLDLADAATLETVGIKNGQAYSRVLVFTDAEGNTVGSVPTVFTVKQGVWAEPMAIELAKELGLDFKANVERWQYDKEAKAQHDKEVALQEKEAAKQAKVDRAKRRQYRIEKRRKKLHSKDK